MDHCTSAHMISYETKTVAEVLAQKSGRADCEVAAEQQPPDLEGLEPRLREVLRQQGRVPLAEDHQRGSKDLRRFHKCSGTRAETNRDCTVDLRMPEQVQNRKNGPQSP